MVHRPVANHDQDEVLAAGPRPNDDEPDMLTRALASDRWPSFIVRFPRLAGIGFLLAGAYGVRMIAELTVEGGWYARGMPALTTLGFTNGLWLLVFGRPADERGYSPEWWNVGWTIVTVLGAAAAFYVYSRYL